MTPRAGDRHYRVVRYYPHYGHGLMQDLLGDDLTLLEAEKVLHDNPAVSSEEEIVIEDKQLIGLESEVERNQLRT